MIYGFGTEIGVTREKGSHVTVFVTVSVLLLARGLSRYSVI